MKKKYTMEEFKEMVEKAKNKVLRDIEGICKEAGEADDVGSLMVQLMYSMALDQLVNELF